MALFGGTGPGTYSGYGGPYNTEKSAELSHFSNSGTVNDPNIPYTGSPQDVAEKLIKDNNQEAYQYLKDKYGH